jgi:hypothetical protein
MTYPLVILILVAIHDEHPAATVPLTLGSYETAATCNGAARDVIKQQILDRYEKDLAGIRADEPGQRTVIANGPRGAMANGMLRGRSPSHHP